MRRLLPHIVCTFLSGYSLSQINQCWFGNLHAHTAFSDGDKDSVATGIKDPAGAYSYAKSSNDFDFLGISEHNHYSTSKNPGFTLPHYPLGLQQADAANQEGKFLSLFGMEYGVSSTNHGHVVIYGFSDLIGWETNIPGTSGNNYGIYNAKYDYVSLFRKVANNHNAFCYLAHPFWTDFSIDGTDSTALAFMPYNAGFDSAIVGMPLRSGNAFSSVSDYSDYPTGNYFDYYKNLLHIGYHLGIGFDHDNHYSNFGRGNGGRLAVVAPYLTRASLYKAMQQMNFYGTDDPNAEISFTMNGQIMGSIAAGSDWPSFRLEHNDADAEHADTMRIWRGYKGSPGLWASVVQMVTGSDVLLFRDTSIVPEREYYYFADIRQRDGQWIVTSPIWYTGHGALSAAAEAPDRSMEITQRDQWLFIDVRQTAKRYITVTDLIGRQRIRTMLQGLHTQLDVSALDEGVYIVSIDGETARRVVIGR